MEVWAFGSRVSGEAHEGSDLDLVLRDPADLSSSQSAMPQLRDALEQSEIPILVDLLDCACIPDEFKQNIEEKYVSIWPEGD